jgi:ATP adenylyltransferase
MSKNMSKSKSKVNSPAKSPGKSPSKSPSKSKGRSQSQKAASHWPKQKNILFRPDRYKYVKAEKNVAKAECVFCLTASSAPHFETLCLYQGAHAQVVMNKYPYNAGHLLVLPLRHEGDLLGLSEAEMSEIYKLTRLAVKALRTEYAPPAFNIGLNLGAQAGAGIPDHLHYHIIPRWAGDTNFFPLIAGTKVIIEDLSGTYKKMQKYFNEKTVKKSSESAGVIQKGDF